MKDCRYQIRRAQFTRTTGVHIYMIIYLYIKKYQWRERGGHQPVRMPLHHVWLKNERMYVQIDHEQKKFMPTMSMNEEDASE